MSKTRSKRKRLNDENTQELIITTTEGKLNDILSSTITDLMKSCFNETIYNFSYVINKKNNKLGLDIEIKNDLLNKHALLEGELIKNDDESFYSKIQNVESNMGFYVGNFLVYVYSYISILMRVNLITLDNATSDQLRSIKGIYSMFKIDTSHDKDEIYDKLQNYFDNYDDLDEIYVKPNLENNKLFMDLLENEEYEEFDDIPSDLINDLISIELLRLSEGTMIYNVTKNSLSNVKNKIYELLEKVDSIDDPNNPWNTFIDGKNIYENARQILDKKNTRRRIIGGKNIKFKSKKIRQKNKTKNKK